jgi:hypothetical protein
MSAIRSANEQSLKRAGRPVRLASLLAPAIALAAVWTAAAPAADGCITQPNFQSAQTGHWYYLTDRASRRKCWFVGPRGPTVHPVSSTKARLAARTAPKPISMARHVDSKDARALDLQQPSTTRSSGRRSDQRAIQLDQASRNALFQQFLQWQKSPQQAGDSGTLDAANRKALVQELLGLQEGQKNVDR